MKPLIHLVSGQPVVRINGNGPGQITRWAVELLVKEVSPAANGLSNQQAGCHIVQPLQIAQTLDAGIDIDAQRPAGHGPKDAKTAHLQAEHLPGVRRVIVPAGDNMVDARPDDARKEGYNQHVPGDLGIVAIPRGELAHDIGGQHSTADDEHAIPVDRDGTDAEKDGVRWHAYLPAWLLHRCIIVQSSVRPRFWEPFLMQASVPLE